jgi:hypothetical protein
MIHKENRKSISILLFLFGVSLLLLNSIGFFIPLKNPAIYNESKTKFNSDSTLTPKETFQQLSELKMLSKEDTAKKSTLILNKSIAHYWEKDPTNSYNTAVPFYHNWILASLQFTYPSIYKQYEYCNYKDAIKRGIGQCSQHAIALTDFLNQHNVESFVVGLDGHVVSTAQVAPSVWWILDPDFGVVIPYSLNEIESSPQLVDSYYKNTSPTREPSKDILDFPAIYGNSGNITYSGAYIGSIGYIDCNWKKVLIEKTSCFLIWIIPLFLIFPYLINLYKKRKKIL